MSTAVTITYQSRLQDIVISSMLVFVDLKCLAS
jgi:hypothetical protein